MLIHLCIFALSFAGMWVGSGLAIKAVERLSKTLRMSQFSVSFVILGLFTSISELSVGVNSIMTNDPEILVGNLIGASIVIFMLIIPLLAVVGRPIRITAAFQGFNLPAALLVVAMPVLLSIDGRVDRLDSLVALILFGLLLFSIQTKQSVLERLRAFGHKSSVSVSKELMRIIFGIVIIFVASKFVVNQTLFFAQMLQVSPFLISLLFIAIGTNIPELALIVRSITMGNNQVAFGDYIGSATFNTFILGMLTLIYGQTIVLNNSYLISLLFLIIGLLLFYYFARTKNSISRAEGLVLLGLYAAFLITEVMLHKSLLFWN